MILYLLTVLFLAFLLYAFWWKRRNLPPGPVPLPIVGNSFQLMSYQSSDAALNAWRKQYGDVFTFWLGGRPIVCLANFTAVNEYLVNQGEKFEDRPDADLCKLLFNGMHGLLLINGDAWKNQRRFALKSLADMGFGNGVIEGLVVDELNDLLRHMTSEVRGGNPSYQLTRQIEKSIGSITNSVLLGYRYTEENRQEFEELKARSQGFMRTIGSPEMFAVRDHMEFFEKVPVLGRPVRLAKQQANHLLAFFENNIRARVQSLDHENLLESEPKDLVAFFLRERARNIAEKGDEEYFTLTQLSAFCMDFWMAGQETTSNTLAWGLAYLIHEPDVQRKAHNELDRVIGSDRIISTTDTPNLTYIMAVCFEIQRLCNLLPFSMVRMTTEDVEVEGYHLPKGSSITPALGCLLYDEKVFPEPHTFKPERFLDSDGNFKPIDQMIPFGAGKRKCLGEGLARLEMFLFVANLLNQFEFRADGNLPDLTRGHGATVHIRDYNCCLSLRRSTP